jgi:hypothetical protein
VSEAPESHHRIGEAFHPTEVLHTLLLSYAFRHPYNIQGCPKQVASLVIAPGIHAL